MNRTLAKSIIFFFSIIGLLISVIFIHENFHKFDYRNIEKTEDSICYLSFGTDAGAYYNFTYKNSQEDIVNKKHKTAEFKAYSFTIPIYFIYLWCLYVLLGSKKQKELKEVSHYD